ncbi:MAG: TIR domain-containing protein, partial [Methyloceanibacter sp.]
MATIILSYRREDTELMVGRICDRLRDHYGRDSVMMDIDSIPYGLDFRKHIREALSRCDLMVAIIGPRWAALNEQGQSRLADDTDWIRIEIEAALAKDVPVIPVLVNGAAMPKTRELPETMQDLAFRQAAPLDMRRDFHTHMDRLIGVMDELLKLRTNAEEVTIEQDRTAPEAEQRSAASASTKPLPPKAEERTAKAETRKAQDEKAKTPPRAPTPKPAEPVHEPAAASEQPLLQRIFVPDAGRRDAQGSALAANWWMVAWRGGLALALGLVWLLADSGSLNSLGSEALGQL